METIRSPTIFRNCSILKDVQMLKEFVEEIKQYFEEARKGGSEESKFMVSALKKAQEKENQNIQKIKDYLDNYIKHEIMEDKYSSLGKEFIEHLCWYMNQALIIPMESILKFKQTIMQGYLHEIKAGIEGYDNRQEIREYIFRKFAEHPEQKQKSIHIVLQSAPHAEKYFHKYYEQIEESMNIYNTIEGQEYRIGTITSSNYYSLASFLHASDFPTEKVEKEIWNLQNLIDVNPDIDEAFQANSDEDFSQYWCKYESTKMKTLEKYAWQHREKTFSIVEDYLDSAKYQNLTPEELKDKSKQYQELLRRKVENEKDEVDEAIQRSLDYVLDEMSQAELEIEDEELSPAEYAERLSKALSLRLENKDIDFESKNKKINNSILNFMYDLTDHVERIIHLLLLKTSNVKEAYEMHSNKLQSKEVFRGLVISEMLTASKVKAYVQKKLEQMNLGRNISLREFYDATEKKIQLNFVVVESPANFVRIINYKTRPQMPVWAAITASCSVPFLFDKFLDRKEWKYTPNYDPKKRKAENYFADP